MRPLNSDLIAIAHEIWDMKYRLKDAAGSPIDKTMDDTWWRVASAVAAAEKESQRDVWAKAFFDILRDFKFLPAGRILAGAGSGRTVTLFSCFVMGHIEDSLGGIFDGLKEAALTMQQGGGIGHDFSTLRPKGAAVRGVGADASGPLSFMDVWDAMCRTIMSAGARRGAMMGTIRCDHPDVESFVRAKQDPSRLRNFNVSVLVTDRFMAAVKADELWPLVFDGKTYREVNARGLWQEIMRSTYDCAEPGVIFIDRINRENNLNYCESISCANPCGEQPLPAYGACLLGSLNLSRFVVAPFTEKAVLDIPALQRTVATAVRFLDDVIDVSNYPLEMQREEARGKRRIGLGITGLADALVMCDQRYGSAGAAGVASAWMQVIEEAAYDASVELASEKGAFPLFDASQYGKSGHVSRLSRNLRAAIKRHGIRNGLLTSIAPTGTISLLAGNVSSGIEPIFSIGYERRVLQPDGSSRTVRVTDFAVALWKELRGADVPLPDSFVTVDDLGPGDHLRMQQALQEHVDSSISKTINVAASIDFSDFKSVYEQAYDLGLKGCTTFRPNAITGAVLTTDNSGVGQPTSDSRRPLDRDDVLPGFTYKLRWPDSDHAIYITMNDVMEEGHRRPFEIFINSKNMEHYAWTVALTRMVSAVFRRGGDVSFVVDELKAVFDPRGGHWLEGRYVPSLLAAIGGVIERHMVEIGFMDRKSCPERITGLSGGGSRGTSCPRCGSFGLVNQEGCATCLSCGFSKCS
ncbi:MAG: adenosylcobalamin-dependent ribonucleoside-diphosphate reductase [Alphaproteobacteria bacterium]|nr:adenosylcobalamin-dependent ribonucleoside-diphosphate reductase [Alphaproteobacteria bacterium]